MMGDVGLFDPMVNWLVKKAGSNIVMVTVATACVAVISHLDGALASTLLITIPAFLPIYKKLHMRPVVICAIIGAAMSIMNLLPWGGPVARCASILNLPPEQLWRELIPLQGVGLVIVIAFAVYMGILEKRRGAGPVPTGKAAELSEDLLGGGSDPEAEAKAAAMKRPKLLWFNALLTIGVILSLCFTKIPMYAAFMFGLALHNMLRVRIYTFFTRSYSIRSVKRSFCTLVIYSTSSSGSISSNCLDSLYTLLSLLSTSCII